MRGRPVGLAAVLGALSLGACELGDPVDGGGPGGGFGPERTVTIVSTRTLDGWVRVDGQVQTTGTQVIVGDADVSGSSRGQRGFYSFDITSIPTGSAVTSATLRVYQTLVVGAPYSSLGEVVVDHVDHGTALDPTDYGAMALTSNVGTISANTLFEYKPLDVTALVQSDVTTAPRARSQFRLRFSLSDSNNNGTGDFAQFGDGENPNVTNQPQLVVKYREPVTP